MFFLLNTAWVVEGVSGIWAFGVLQKLLRGTDVDDNFERVASVASIPPT